MMSDDPKQPSDTPPTASGGPDGKKPDESELRRLGGLLGMGLQLALTVAAFAGAGWWAETHWGWPAWSRTGLGILGIVIGLYLFVKDATQ